MIRSVFPHMSITSAFFSLVGGSATAGYGLSGASIIVSSNSAHWVAQVTVMVRGDRYSQGAWLEFVSSMRGVLGAAPIFSPTCFPVFDSQAVDYPQRRAVPVGETPAWGHFGLGQPEHVHARLAANADLRSEFLDIELVDCLGLQAGDQFSIGESLHEVTAQYQLSESVQRLHIAPLLRRDFLAGERVVVDHPFCLMRFATETEGRIDRMSRLSQAVTVNFVEHVS